MAGVMASKKQPVLVLLVASICLMAAVAGAARPLRIHGEYYHIDGELLLQALPQGQVTPPGKSGCTHSLIPGGHCRRR